MFARKYKSSAFALDLFGCGHYSLFTEKRQELALSPTGTEMRLKRYYSTYELSGCQGRKQLMSNWTGTRRCPYRGILFPAGIEIDYIYHSLDRFYALQL